MCEDERLRRLLRRLIQPAETMDGFGTCGKAPTGQRQTLWLGTYEFRVAFLFFIGQPLKLSYSILDPYT